jgi:hypothetical protein
MADLAVIPDRLVGKPKKKKKKKKMPQLKASHPDFRGNPGRPVCSKVQVPLGRS